MSTTEIVPSTPSQPTSVPAPKAAPAHKGNSGTELSEAELHQLVAQAAYRRAERRAFAPGRELDDWLEAEAEVGRRPG